MRHRTQLYLDEQQHRWLRRRAATSGSIAAVVRDLIDAARERDAELAGDPLIRYLGEEDPGVGPKPSTVTTLDEDIYGA